MITRIQKISILTVLLVCISLLGYSQATIIEGVLFDIEQEQPLPYANIIFKGTTVGGTTDINGNFYIRTNDLTLDTLFVTYLGFKDQFIIIKPGEKQTLKIELISNAQVLDEFVVSGKKRVPKDTAAITLYRNVVKNKPNNEPSEYDFYQYSMYEKAELGFYDLTDKFKEGKIIKRFPYLLDNIDTLPDGTEVLPVLIKESARDIYYRKDPKKKKVIVKGAKFSGVETFSITSIVDYNFEALNVYDNILKVNEKAFQSPFSNNAQFNYKFFLTDTSVIDGMVCYKLLFTGRNKQDAAFSGHAWIHDTTYAIKSIKLTVLPNVNLNFIKDFAIEQNFIRIDGKFWFKNYDYMQTQYNIITSENKKKQKERQSLLIRKAENYSRIKINVPISEEFMRGDIEEVDENAMEKDESFWEEVRTEQLKEREQNIYASVDSIKNSKLYKTLRYITYLGSSGWFDAKFVEFGRIYQFFSWDDVQGKRVRLDLRTRDELSDIIAVGGYFAYGFRDQTWKYGGNFLLDVRPKDVRWQIIGGRHYYDLSTLTDYNPILVPGSGVEYDNIISSLLRRDPLDDLFFLRNTELWYEREWIKHLNTRMSFKHREYLSVPSGISFYSPGDGIAMSDSTVVDNFMTSEFTFNLIWGKSVDFINFGLSRFPRNGTKPVFLFNYTAGVKNLFGSDFAYHKINVGIRQKLLGPIGYTIYRLEAGYNFGNAPYVVQKIHPGNESFLYDLNTFNVMGESEFVSSRYAHIWIIHHFDGTIFNKIPGINKLQLRSIFTMKALYGNLEDKTTESIYLPEAVKPLDGFYVETGVGVENILKVFRVDFLFRLTQRDQPDVNKWGFRFSIAPNF